MRLDASVRRARRLQGEGRDERAVRERVRDRPVELGEHDEERHAQRQADQRRAEERAGHAAGPVERTVERPAALVRGAEPRDVPRHQQHDDREAEDGVEVVDDQQVRR